MEQEFFQPAARMREVEMQIVQLSPALTAFARTFRLSQTDVEDLVQGKVVKALRAIHSYETGTALKSWLFTIMRNTFCTMFNKQKRESVGVEPYYGEMVMQPTQEWAVRHHELEVALQRLPSERRDALVSVAYGISYEDVQPRQIARWARSKAGSHGAARNWQNCWTIRCERRFAAKKQRPASVWWFDG